MRDAFESLRRAFPEAVATPVDDRIEVTLPAATSDEDLDRATAAIQAMKLSVRVGVSRAGRSGA